MQRSFVQWEGMTGAMRAQMGVNLNYPVGLPDNLEYIVRGDAGWSDAAGEWELVSGCVYGVDGIAAGFCAG